MMLTPFVKQTWVTSSTLLNKVGSGMIHGSMSCLLLALKEPDSPIKMSIHTSSSFVASIGFSCAIGFFLASITMNHFGRRIAFLMITVPGIIGMLLISFSSNIIALFIGRILSGITIGSTSVTGAVVVGEYTSPQYRGMFLNVKTTCLNIGMLIVHILGEYYHWRTVAILSAVPLIISVCITYTWPESPFWLADKKRFKESEKSFFWLRGESDDSIREIKELIKSQKDVEVKKTVKEHLIGFLQKFKKKNFIKPTVIVVTGMFLLEASGRHFFPTYAGVLVKEITSNNVNSFYYTIIIDVLIILSGTLSVILVKVLGIRKLLFFSGLTSLSMLYSACLFMYLIFNGFLAKTYLGLPLFLFVSYFFLTNLGCNTVPLAIAGEIFPLEHRAFGSSIPGYFISIIMTLSLKLMPYMLAAFNIYGTFAILGVCMGLALTVLYIMLPETKDRTLVEIEYFFKHGRFRDEHLISVKKNDEELQNFNVKSQEN